MNRYRFALVCTVAVITMGLAPVASAELPDHDEEIFVWTVEDGAEDVDKRAGRYCFLNETACTPYLPATNDLPGTFARTSCVLMAEGNDPNNSPCEALRYDMGHTDSHMFFRWTMASLEFNPESPIDFTLFFDSGFRGNHPSNEPHRNFEFLLGVNAEEAWVETAQAQVGQDEWEDWTDDTLIGIDRGAGTLTVAIPIGLLESRVDPERGALVGEWFNVTRAPEVGVVNEQCSSEDPVGQFCPSSMREFKADDIFGAQSDENRTYGISPIGELKPRVVEESISGPSHTITLDLARPTWETYQYVWDAAMLSGFTIDQEVALDNGTVDITMLGPDEEVLYESLEASGEASGEVEDLESGQEWTLRIELAEWAEGNITVQLEGIEYIPEGTGGNGNGGDSGGDGDDGNEGGNETDDGADLDSKDSPAPGVVLLLAALVGLVALYRRR